MALTNEDKVLIELCECLAGYAEVVADRHDLHVVVPDAVKVLTSAEALLNAKGMDVPKAMAHLLQRARQT
jgi:hypothetical protein